MSVKGTPVKSYPFPTKRYVQFLEIANDPALHAAYVRVHSPQEVWPEIPEGIRAVGILEMDLYMVGNKVVMIVDTPMDFDWDSAMARLATLPRQAEWEAHVALLQACDPSATSDEKWTMMHRIFTIPE